MVASRRRTRPTELVEGWPVDPGRCLRSLLADPWRERDDGCVDAAAQAYVDEIAPEARVLFDRIHGLIVGEFPDVEVGISYRMPVYRRESWSLNVGAWKHGVSIYGFPEECAVSIIERHPELSSGRGTLRITHAAADDISDQELIRIVRGALGDGGATLQI